MDTENILANLVRIGTVHNISASAKRARVKFEDMDMISDWLVVLQRPAEIVSVAEAGLHTHEISDSYSGGGSASQAGKHTHTAQVASWMPKINDKVLVIYLPIYDADGFVLGVI